MATRTGKIKEPVSETAEPLVEEEEEELVVDEVVEEEEEWDSRKMPPDQEVWPGGPKFKQINAWKDQYGDIYVTSITPEKHVVWRTLNRFEYRRAVKQLEQLIASGMSTAEANLNNEEIIAEMCILFPKYSRASQAEEMAGIPYVISQQCMEASGFNSVEVRQL